MELESASPAVAAPPAAAPAAAAAPTPMEVEPAAPPAAAAPEPAPAPEAAAPAPPVREEADAALAPFDGAARHVAGAPVADPDAVEMRLVSLLDEGGAIAGGTDAGVRFYDLLAKAERKGGDAALTRATLCVVLRRTCAASRKLETRAFLNAGGLKPLGGWLEAADAASDDPLLELVLAALADLPVTARIIRASDVGKTVKKLRNARRDRGGGDDPMGGKFRDLMARWYERANDAANDDAEEQALAAAEAAAREAASAEAAKKKKAARKRAAARAAPGDALAAAFQQKRPREEAKEALGDREARIAARRKGRNAGGVKTVVVDTREEGDDWEDDGIPKSRSIDPEVAERLARRVPRVKWADADGGDIASYKDPVEGWLDSLAEEEAEVEHLEDVSAAERSRRERAAEREALQRAKREAAEERQREDEDRLRRLRDMAPARAWRDPPPKTGEPPVEVEVTATEPATQAARQKRLMEARYLHPRDIPFSPDEADTPTTALTVATETIPLEAPPAAAGPRGRPRAAAARWATTRRRRRTAARPARGAACRTRSRASGPRSCASCCRTSRSTIRSSTAASSTRAGSRP